MTDIVEATQKQDPGSEVIILFDLEYDTTTPTSAYFHSGGYAVTSSSTPVKMRDRTTSSQINFYEPLPMTVDGFDISSDGAMSRPTVTIANISSVFSDAVGGMEYEDLLGKKLIRRTTLKKFLYGEAGDAQPPVEYPITTYIIDRIKEKNILQITFELAAPYDLAGVTLPRRKIIGGTCPWQYQGASDTISEDQKRGGCDWNEFSNVVYNGTTFQVYVNREDEYIVPYSIANAATAYSSSATAGTYYTTTTANGLTKVNADGTHTVIAKIDYWQCLTANSTTPTDSNNNYRRVRYYHDYAAGSDYAVYTDIKYNAYTKYQNRIWQAKVRTQAGNSHISAPKVGTYWTRGDNCAKKIGSCAKRFAAVPVAAGGVHHSTTQRQALLPFGGFPASRQFR